MSGPSSPSQTTAGSQRRKPKVVAFDLDGTIWTPDMYMLWGGGAPFEVVSKDTLRDVNGARVTLLGDSGAILDELATSKEWNDVNVDVNVDGPPKVAWVSCTDEPSWADECMHKFQTPMGVPLVERIDEQCIYKANKQVHFRDLKKRLSSSMTDIEFEDMLFFDNERYNVEDVSQLGVVSVHCPRGMTREVWLAGLNAFAERHPNQSNK